MNGIHEVAPGIGRLKVPFIHPSQTTNCYLLEGEDGYTVIDCGFSAKSGKSLWLQALASRGISTKAIARIVITHHHVDHFGLAKWMQELAGAPVFMSDKASEQAQYTWGAESSYVEDMQALYQACGIPNEALHRLMISVRQYRALVKELPQITVLSEQDTVVWGAQRYSVCQTHGHAEGHLLLYNEQSGILFSGDHVLMETIPNLGFTCGFDALPLKRYLLSLSRLAELPVDLVLPGHGEPFANLEQPVVRISAHYQWRLEQLLQLCSVPRTPFEIYAQWNAGDVVPSRLRYGMIELKALLDHLVEKGQLIAEDKGLYRLN